MKLIMENWRDTSWTTDGETVTIGDVSGYLGDVTVDINAAELIEKLPTLPIGSGNIDEAFNRMAAASLEHPIIIVKSDGEYQFVLDGNHRLQRAIETDIKSMKAKILDLDDEKTPKVFKKVFA